MTNGSEPARIAVSPSWALDSVLDTDAAAVRHSLEGSISFSAQTDLLSMPLVPQHLRVQVTDRLKLDGTDGLTVTREPIDVILIQDEPDIAADGLEVVLWSLDQARVLHAALGELLGLIDAAGGK